MAIFRWKRRPAWKEGDTRAVYRFLWLPVTIGDETRWLGFQRVKEQAYIGWICAPETRPFEGLKWRIVAFDDFVPIKGGSL